VDLNQFGARGVQMEMGVGGGKGERSREFRAA